MKKHRGRRILGYTFVIACASLSSPGASGAQVELPTLGLAYLDNIGRIGMGGGGGGARFLTADAEPKTPDWYDNYSLGYFYSRLDSKRPGDEETDLHTVVPEVFFYHRTSFSIDASMAYTRADSDDTFGTDRGSNIFDATVIPAQELLRYFTDPGTQATWLHLGVLIGYRHTDNEFDSPLGSGDSNSDVFVCGPNLVLKHTPLFRAPYKPLLDLYLVPAYLAQVGSVSASGSPDFDIATGVLSVLARGDWWVRENVVLLATAQWRHDAHQDTNPIPETHEHWGEFGGSLRWAITTDVGLRFGYSYTAFRSDYDGHSAYLRIEMPPWPI